jgi:hypothetical protein
VLLQKYQARRFLEVSDLFFYWKIYGIGLQLHELGPWALAHGELIFIKMQPMTTGWTTRIQQRERVSCYLIVTNDQLMDG